MSQTQSPSPPVTGKAPVHLTPSDDRTIRSRADVATAAPARYAKQLISHLGRKLDFVGDATTATASIGAATACIAVGDGVLVLSAAGDDEECVARVEQVLGGHLERFAQREALAVRWVRTVGAPSTMSVSNESPLEEQS